jgi:hypothetical protein
MKITAEFNSNEELVSFISTFGAKTFKPEVGAAEGQKESKKVADIQEDIKENKKETSKVEPSKEDKKEEVPKVDAEVVGVDVKTTDTKDAEIVKEDKKEETKITKEMVRAVFSKLIKAGKQKEAKDLTSKYGASKLPDLKEEDYAAAYKDAEGLL